MIQKWYSCWKLSRRQKTSVPVIDSLRLSASKLKFALKFAHICKHWVRCSWNCYYYSVRNRWFTRICEGIQCQWTDSRLPWIQLLTFTVCFKAIFALNSLISSGKFLIEQGPLQFPGSVHYPDKLIRKRYFLLNFNFNG